MEPWRTQSCDDSGGGSNKALMLVHVPVNGCSGSCHRCEAHTCQVWGYRNILTCMRYFLATGQTTFDRLCCVALPTQIRILIHLMRLMKMMVVTAQLLWHLFQGCLKHYRHCRERKAPDKKNLSLSLLQLGCPGPVCWKRLVIIQACDFDTRLSYSMIKNAKCVVFASAMMYYMVFRRFIVSSYHCMVTPSWFKYTT